MSITERPTFAGRPRLSLPGYAPPAATQVPRPVPAVLGRPSVSVPAQPGGAELPEPYEHGGRLSPTYWGRMRDELAAILGVAAGELLPVFAPRIPLPLKVGIHADLLAAYPAATRTALGKWLSRWVSTSQYRKALAAGGMRHDIDANVCGEITADAAAHAR